MSGRGRVDQRWQRGFPLDLASDCSLSLSLSLFDYRPSLELVFIYRALFSHRVCGRLTLFFVPSFSVPLFIPMD